MYNDIIANDDNWRIHVSSLSYNIVVTILSSDINDF